MISITVNNIKKEVEDNTSIQHLLDNLNQTEKGIALAINNKVIRKEDWANTVLGANDTVLIIQATQGG